MGKLRYQFPAEPNKAERYPWLSRVSPPQLSGQRLSHWLVEVRLILNTHAERAGLVILHQQLTPVVPGVMSLLSPEYTAPKLPSIELHEEMPDTDPPFALSGKKVDHVPFVKSYALPFSPDIPPTDGSKIMDVLSPRRGNVNFYYLARGFLRCYD